VAKVGVSTRLVAMPVITIPTRPSPNASRTIGIAIITKVNSLPWASKKPSCTEPGVDQPKTLAAVLTRTALIAMRANRKMRISVHDERLAQ
ncbi:MAG TPA: hypothetical protein DD706_04340, partial [Nitrospiraceae bacterium]|nr:hypothetical protein [Nitrospiraceae bacterium]